MIVARVTVTILFALLLSAMSGCWPAKAAILFHAKDIAEAQIKKDATTGEVADAIVSSAPIQPPLSTEEGTASVAPGDCEPLLFVTEVHRDPAMVPDALGEFIELYNGGATPIRLAGWTLADLHKDRHVITRDVVIMPAHFLVLGQTTDQDLNGGIPVDYAWDHFNLANQTDRIVLTDPCGNRVWDVRYPQKGFPRSKKGRSVALVADPRRSEAPAWRLTRRLHSTGDRISPGYAEWQ